MSQFSKLNPSVEKLLKYLAFSNAPKPKHSPIAQMSDEERKEYYIRRHLPEKVRLEASTVCQLKCAGCDFQKGGSDNLGRGFLTIENFKKFCDMNPFVRRIELSNYGEIFLNPDLVKIMHYAKEKGVKLTAKNGSNFNTVSDEQMRALVETGFHKIILSIDGASQQTYSKYRIGGNFDRVIENVRKLQAIKKQAGSKLPRLVWQFVLMEHNELEVGKAKELAAELEIPIYFKTNWDETYKPVNREYLVKETGMTELTRAEHYAVHKVDPIDAICSQIFIGPQINWDGRLLGCCKLMYADFGVNVFDIGLENALRSPKYIAAKECLLTLHPDEERYADCACMNCITRLRRDASGLVVNLPKE